MRSVGSPHAHSWREGRGGPAPSGTCFGNARSPFLGVSEERSPFCVVCSHRRNKEEERNWGLCFYCEGLRCCTATDLQVIQLADKKAILHLLQGHSVRKLHRPVSQEFPKKLELLGKKIKESSDGQQQLKLRPAPLPEYVPDSTEVIFGKNDMNEEKLEERRKRAREYSKYQLQAAADRKRAAILNQLVDQRRAADMIQRAKKQWMVEKGERMERLFQMNLAIQEDWRKSAGLKRQRDYEEKLFQRAGDKLMLLDQCARYRRCYQCKKGLNKFGEKNIWTDSKYIPGSRLII